MKNIYEIAECIDHLELPAKKTYGFLQYSNKEMDLTETYHSYDRYLTFKVKGKQYKTAQVVANLLMFGEFDSHMNIYYGNDEEKYTYPWKLTINNADSEEIWIGIEINYNFIGTIDILSCVDEDASSGYVTFIPTQKIGKEDNQIVNVISIALGTFMAFELENNWCKAYRKLIDMNNVTRFDEDEDEDDKRILANKILDLHAANKKQQDKIEELNLQCNILKKEINRLTTENIKQHKQNDNLIIEIQSIQKRLSKNINLNTVLKEKQKDFDNKYSNQLRKYKKLQEDYFKQKNNYELSISELNVIIENKENEIKNIEQQKYEAILRNRTLNDTINELHNKISSLNKQILVEYTIKKSSSINEIKHKVLMKKP
ncbi:hypothetical protein ACTQX2_00075 [Megamonas funiformis]|uniref:hypothetical protein n=1 Tax=Megamonas funiformis TaxID=437897 RepID=UPI003F9823B3